MSTDNHLDLIEFSASSSEEVTAMKNFFTEVFDWQFKDYGDGYSDTADSGLTVGINGTNREAKASLAVIYTEDLEATRDKILKAGGKIIQDVYSFPGGRRFHFTDPSGNELAAWSE